MGKMFDKINSIICEVPQSIVNYKVKGKLETYYRYIIVEPNLEQTDITKCTLEELKNDSSTKIIDSNNNFVNGFKVVQTENEEYAYIRESDGELLPYRYDVASNFNEYGYAMVAKKGNATWINSNFQYLSSNGKMVDEKLENGVTTEWEQSGFRKVFQFSEGAYPLSMVYEKKDGTHKARYFTPNGNIQEFYKFNGQLSKLEKATEFKDFKNFGNKDYIIVSDGILFAKGYYCPLEYLVTFCEQEGLISQIFTSIDEKITKKSTQLKTLKP